MHPKMGMAKWHPYPYHPFFYQAPMLPVNPNEIPLFCWYLAVSLFIFDTSVCYSVPSLPSCTFINYPALHPPKGAWPSDTPALYNPFFYQAPMLPITPSWIPFFYSLVGTQLYPYSFFPPSHRGLVSIQVHSFSCCKVAWQTLLHAPYTCQKERLPSSLCHTNFSKSCKSDPLLQPFAHRHNLTQFLVFFFTFYFDIVVVKERL